MSPEESEKVKALVASIDGCKRCFRSPELETVRALFVVRPPVGATTHFRVVHVTGRIPYAEHDLTFVTLPEAETHKRMLESLFPGWRGGLLRIDGE